MSEKIRVVVHFTDGSLLKGTMENFLPNSPSFHLLPTEGGPRIEIHLKHLKAVFFVKNLEGKPRRRDIRGFLAAPRETGKGVKVAVLFKDGELLCGYSSNYSADKQGFFLFPADPDGNNIRVYVLSASAEEIHAGLDADTFARKAAGKRTA